MVELTVIYTSMYMESDKLVLKADTVELAKQMYFDWWKSYGKDEAYAIEMVIETDLKEISDDT